MKGRRLSGIVIIATAVALCASARAQRSISAEKTVSYDGKWWLSVSSLEQRGYINGAFDCDTWELGDRSAPNSTAKDVQKFVSQFYEDPPNWHLPVFRVIRTFYSRHAEARQKGSRTGGEAWSGPHGYWDGLWWKGAGYPNILEQLGYVEGYLACYQGEAPSPKGTFSKSAGQYVSLITGWYKTTGKEDAKIADVLFKFRDHSQPSDPGSK